jgi:galactoside O-acetyltransferase
VIDPSITIDETVRIYGRRDLLTIGAGSRIDAYAVITVGDGGVTIGENVHVGCGAYLFGGGGNITIGEGCSLSPRSTIYTSCDDFRKRRLIGPCNPREERNVIEGDVTMEDGSALGHGAVMFPGSVLHKGSAVGAYLAVIEDVDEYMLITAKQESFRSRRREW